MEEKYLNDIHLLLRQLGQSGKDSKHLLKSSSNTVPKTITLDVTIVSPATYDILYTWLYGKDKNGKILLPLGIQLNKIDNRPLPDLDKLRNEIKQIVNQL